MRVRQKLRGLIFASDSNFDGADFTNAIVDRASFKGSSLRGTIFANAVLTGTSFEDADVENADFTEAYIGGECPVVCRRIFLLQSCPYHVFKL